MRAVDRMDFGSVRISPDYRLPSHTLTSIKRHEPTGWDIIRSINADEAQRVEGRKQRRLAIVGKGIAGGLVMAAAFVFVLQPLADWLVS